ncbi:hypothetical protein SB2_06905 [Methylobacterium radiotolerans]|nr:hypothetical protein SB3_08950 [Methylobacterium radiotolerans]KTS49273.1 hypothetical protein SB2_06905 [Methylobacterium radiotolerans]
MAQPSPDRDAVNRLTRLLDGFARGLGLDSAEVRAIVEAVITDMPDRPDEDRQMEARKRMLKAAA